MFCPKCGSENPDEGKFCRKCGTDLSAVSHAIGADTHTGMDLMDQGAFLTVSEDDGTCYSMGSGRRRRRSKDPVDIYAAGIRSAVFGFGFLIIAAVLFFTNVAGGQSWWWAMLFPGFSMLAGGVGNIAKSKRIEKRLGTSVAATGNDRAVAGATARSLPEAGTDFVAHGFDSRYETGDLVPPSVVENTTRHLKVESENETMTLPDIERKKRK